MNKVTRQRYPVERLPADLRGDLPDGTLVDIRIEASHEASTGPATRRLIANLHGSEADVLRHIRQLRDED